MVATTNFDTCAETDYNMSVHADPPPATVSEPNGFHYATGPQLGKGGFAICHRAEVVQDNTPTGRVVALKIVKSKMEPAKLAQKVLIKRWNG